MEEGRASKGPHQGQPVHIGGEPLSGARAAMLIVHGRGATAPDILTLAEEFDVRGFAYLAPQAAGNTWYPNRFLVPLAENEPWLSSALRLLDDVVAEVTGAGVPRERIMLLGFSQGACLALEYAARHAARYGGIVGLSGALIGPPDTPREYAGTLEGTPVFLGSSDVDFHVPRKLVDDTAEVFRRLGGDVTKRLYPNMGHTVNRDELDFVNEMMQRLASG